MSEAERNHRQTDSDPIEARASEWLARSVAEGLTPEEQGELDDWLNESAAHRVAYLRLKSAWSQTERLAALRHAKPEDAKPGARKPARAWFVRAAAVAAIAAVMAGGGVSYLRQPRDRTYATPVGGHETVAFADGTKIELNTDTLIRARMTTNERTIWLDHGEAYFQVKHNAARPFTVMVAGHKITDLGTKFIVTADAGKLQVALVQGRARIDTADKWMAQHSALLKPGDVVLATTDSMSRTRESTNELATQLSWRRGLLVFHRTPLAEAAYQINRYNREKVRIADAALNDLPISGTLSATDPDQFARVLENIFGLKAQRTRGEIVISH